MTVQKQTETTPASSTLGSLFARVVFAAVIILLVHFGWPTEWSYRFQHDEHHTKIVSAGPQPEDCDFLTAPLGSKGCSYT